MVTATVVFSIGSFGDITAILKLAWAVRGLLAEAASAAADVQRVVDDLDAFSQSLQQIKAVLETRGEQLNADIRNGIVHALKICDGVLRLVENQLSAYRRGLERTHGRAWRKYWAMLAWSALGGRKAADGLKRRLSEQVHAVHTYLALSQSHDQTRLLRLAAEQRTRLTRVYEVVEDISKRFDFGVPSFRFQDPFDGQYYLPMGRTSLQKLSELYDEFMNERTCIGDVPDSQAHRTLLIPIGFRYHHTFSDPAYAVVDCVIFRDAPFGLPQVLMSVPWLVERRCQILCGDNAHTPFYERTAVGKQCAVRHTEAVHMHFRACEQILMRQDVHFDDFWAHRREQSLVELSSFCDYGPPYPYLENPPGPNILNKLEEPNEQLRRFIKSMCSRMFPKPGNTAEYS